MDDPEALQVLAGEFLEDGEIVVGLDDGLVLAAFGSENAGVRVTNCSGSMLRTRRASKKMPGRRFSSEFLDGAVTTSRPVRARVLVGR